MLQFRPTPPHLTSAVAEGLLSQACENEVENSKRMKMGLEPLSAAPMPRRTANDITSTPVQPHASTAGRTSMPSLVPAINVNPGSAQAVPSHRILPDWRLVFRKGLIFIDWLK